MDAAAETNWPRQVRRVRGKARRQAAAAHGVQAERQQEAQPRGVQARRIVGQRLGGEADIRARIVEAPLTDQAQTQAVPGPVQLRVAFDRSAKGRFGLQAHRTASNGTAVAAGLLSGPATQASVADGEWHHVAATYDGWASRVYVDGTEVGWRATQLATPAGGALVIGNALPGMLSEAFTGALDDVRVYARALSPAEVFDQCMVSFQAGHETTATALLWWVRLLAEHPEAVLVVHPALLEHRVLVLERRVLRELGVLLGATVAQPGTLFGNDFAFSRKLSRELNDYGAKLLRDHPGRFGLFAAIGTPLISWPASVNAAGYAGLAGSGMLAAVTVWLTPQLSPSASA